MAQGFPGDLTDPQFCRDAVERTARELGRLDILVSNAAWQDRKESIEEITAEVRPQREEVPPPTT